MLFSCQFWTEKSKRFFFLWVTLWKHHSGIRVCGYGFYKQLTRVQKYRQKQRKNREIIGPLFFWQFWREEQQKSKLEKPKNRTKLKREKRSSFSGQILAWKAIQGNIGKTKKNKRDWSYAYILYVDMGSSKAKEGKSCASNDNLDCGKYARYTQEQVEILERVYSDCPKPSSSRRQQLIRECPILANIGHKQLKVWFQNRRYVCV